MLLRCFVVALTAALCASLPGANCCKDAVAVVSSVSGEVSMRAQRLHDRAPVQKFDWLPRGARIEVGPRSSVTIILLSGRQYELGPEATVSVGPETLSDSKGPVRELKPLPPLPTPAPIAGSTSVAAAVVRFRGTVIHNLYPRDGMAVLAGAVRLSFSRLPEAARYEVSLQDDDGVSLGVWTTSGDSVDLPAGSLMPGARYSWRVRGMDKEATFEGNATFVTLDARESRSRTQFSYALQSAADRATALALLGDVDLRLGLLREAKAEFENAQRLNANDPGIRRGLDLVNAALSEGSEKKE